MSGEFAWEPSSVLLLNDPTITSIYWSQVKVINIVALHGRINQWLAVVHTCHGILARVLTSANVQTYSNSNNDEILHIQHPLLVFFNTYNFNSSRMQIQSSRPYIHTPENSRPAALGICNDGLLNATPLIQFPGCQYRQVSGTRMTEVSITKPDGNIRRGLRRLKWFLCPGSLTCRRIPQGICLFSPEPFPINELVSHFTSHLPQFRGQLFFSTLQILWRWR